MGSDSKIILDGKSFWGDSPPPPPPPQSTERCLKVLHMLQLCTNPFISYMNVIK